MYYEMIIVILNIQSENYFITPNVT